MHNEWLNPADHHSPRIRKVDEDFSRELGFKNKKFPIKITDIHKIGEKNCIGTSVLGYGNKQKYPIYVPKNIFTTW